MGVSLSQAYAIGHRLSQGVEDGWMEVWCVRVSSAATCCSDVRSRASTHPHTPDRSAAESADERVS